MRNLALLLLPALAAGCVHDENPSRPPGTAVPAAALGTPGAEGPDFVEGEPWQPDRLRDREAEEEPRERWPLALRGPGDVRGTATVYETRDRELMLDLELEALPVDRGPFAVALTSACTDPKEAEPAEILEPEPLGAIRTDDSGQRGYLLAPLEPRHRPALRRSSLSDREVVVHAPQAPADRAVIACADLAPLDR